MEVRKFALVVVDNLDREVDRFNLDYADTPKNLGFEIEYTTIESRLTTVFTSAKEKKIPTTINLNFIPPNAYNKVAAFRQFVQRHVSDRVVFEYHDTVDIKYWEGKIQKFDLSEMSDWGGITCPISFLPSTPKYLKRLNLITIRQSTYGKSYPYHYAFSYGTSSSEGNLINNEYFDEIPLRIFLYGKMSNPQVSLRDVSTGEIYSSVRLDGLTIDENEHVLIDAINAKALLYRDGEYSSIYDYLGKQDSLDSFLFARASSKSEILTTLDPAETGYLEASYRQYSL